MSPARHHDPGAVGDRSSDKHNNSWHAERDLAERAHSRRSPASLRSLCLVTGSGPGHAGFCGEGLIRLPGRRALPGFRALARPVEVRHERPNRREFIDCGRGSGRAAVQRRSAGRAGGVLGRLLRSDPRRVHPRPAPVHLVVRDSTGCTCSPRSGRTSSATPATSRPGVGPAPRSRAGCAPSPGSTATPSRKTCSTTHPPLTCAGPGWITSRTRLPLTATRSAGVGRRRARQPIEHALISLLAINGLRDLRSARRGHRRPRHRARPSHPDRAAQGREDRHHPARPAHRPRDRPRRRRTRSTGRSSCAPTGTAWTGTAPAASCTASPAEPGSNKTISPHTLRHAFITAALDAGVPLRDVQEAASRRSENDDARRPRPRLPRPARHLYRRRLPRRRRPLKRGSAIAASRRVTSPAHAPVGRPTRLVRCAVAACLTDCRSLGSFSESALLTGWA